MPIFKPDDVSVFEVNGIVAGHKPWNTYSSNACYEQIAN